MRIALVQQRAGLDKDENVERGLAALEQAARGGARLVGYAELAFERFYPQCRSPTGGLELAEPVPGPITERFAAKARELGVVVVLNLYERDGARCFDCSPVIDADGTLLGRTRMVHITDGANCYDCSPVIDADGTLLGRTRMVHITDYEGFHERDYYTPGDTGAPVYRTAVGRLGVAICYDRHYPEYMRALAVAGAELVVVPQAGAVAEWPEGLYEAEMRVAAFQNGYFVALCNRVGPEERLHFAGESFVCAPDGTLLARAAEGRDEIVFCDLDLKSVPTSHARTLFLKDRRPELYADWLNPPASRVSG